MKKIENSAVEPIKAFLQGDLRSLKVCIVISELRSIDTNIEKEAKKTLEQAQKNFDQTIARHASQAKSKEPSALREDAFQLHEARKIYLKASMDFCVLAPQVRSSLDRLLVRLFTDRWRDMKMAREQPNSAFQRWESDMNRVRGWNREMETSEKVFKRELQLARKSIEESAERAARPSREMDDYAVSTVPYIGSQAASSQSKSEHRAEKQGWVFQKTSSGKPTRTYWIRRWYYVRNGIFGWLNQGLRSGAVEESEKIGVLLCSIRPAFQEERRFCFEVKTNSATIVLQAETQSDLMDWISSFEMAKRKALEDPDSNEGSNSLTGGPDAAFAISPPVAPELAARAGDSHGYHGSEDAQGFERSLTLPTPELASSSTFDVTSRRSTALERDPGESRREHAARIIEKLDLHRRGTASPQVSGGGSPAPGGIASLVSASHNMLPAMQPILSDNRPSQNFPTSSLAPSTLANPPAPTNLSKTAVVVTGERNLSVGRSDGNMPGGLMANLWGSTNWGHINRLERGEIKELRDIASARSPKPSPLTQAATDPGDVPPGADIGVSQGSQVAPSDAPLESPPHRKASSTGYVGAAAAKVVGPMEDYPNYYPLPLKAQDAQFRILFPAVPRDERVLMVFRAVWNPTDQQEFPGRVYVTSNEIYFFSNHIGLVLITGVALSTIDEITAAPGRDCDFLYVHFKEGVRSNNGNRLTVKVFLENLKLLQRRLSYLVRNSAQDTPVEIEEILRSLIRMEVDDTANSPTDSWEDVDVNTPTDGFPGRQATDLKTSLRIDGDLFNRPVKANKNITKFKLPSHPVVYAPQGMHEKVVEKEFDVTAKALFHLIFGDKSALFQLMYRDRKVSSVIQGPWTQNEQGLHRRNFEYDNDSASPATRIIDYQLIEVYNDHLCYEVMEKRVPWNFPYAKNFVMVSKIVITHSAKSKCKLAVYTRLDWIKPILFGQSLIQSHALKDLEISGLDLVRLATDQVFKLGTNSRTQKSIQIFGYVGRQTEAAQITAPETPQIPKKTAFKLKRRTMPGMLFKALFTIIVAWIMTSLGWLVAALGALAKVVTAHNLLVLVLVISSGFNILYTSQGTVGWWTQRNANNFMRRLGVGPSTMMHRAVYLQDVDQWINATTVSASTSNKW